MQAAERHRGLEERRGRRGGERGRRFISQVHPVSWGADDGGKIPTLVSFSPTSPSLTCRAVGVKGPGAQWSLLSRTISFWPYSCEENTFWINSGLVLWTEGGSWICFCARASVGPHLTWVSSLWSEKCASLIIRLLSKRLSVGIF